MGQTPVACLVKIGIGNEIRTHFMSRPNFVIGRSKDADLSIASSTLSRHHLRVDVFADSVTITDLKSNNGTFLDGVALEPEKPVTVRPNQKVKLAGMTEEMTFLCFPLPLELMNIDEQREILKKTMREVESEILNSSRLAIEQERKANQSALLLEKEQMRVRLESGLEDRRKVTESSARAIIDEAEKRAAAIMAKAEEEAGRIQSEGVKKSLESQREFEAALEKLEQKSRVDASEIINQAQQKAAKIVADARVIIKKEKDLATSASDSLQKKAQEQYQERLAAATREAQLMIEKAQKQAFSIEQESKAEVLALYEDGERRVTKIIEEANARAALEGAEQRRAIIESGREEAIKEQENIVNQYRKTIEDLQTKKQKVSSEVSQLNVNHEKLKNDHATMERALKVLEERILERRMTYNQIHGDLTAAQKVIAEKDGAKAKIKELEAKTKEIESKYEAYRRDYLAGVQNIERDLKELKEKSVLEYEDHQKELKNEMVKSRLEALDKLSSGIQQEQEKFRKKLETQTLEIAQSIESKILPRLESELRSKGVEVSLGSFLKIIRDAVNEVAVDKHAISQVAADHPAVDVETKQKKKLLYQRAAFAAVTVVVLSLVYFREPVMTYFESMRSQNNYTDYLIAKRNAESIYTPVQSTEWKETYTGNILYLEHYHEAKVDPVYENQWALKLNNLEFLRQLKLNEDEIIHFIGSESALIQQLWTLRQSIDEKYLDEGLARMQQAEIKAVAEMKVILKSDDNFEKVRNLEKEFTLRYIEKVHPKTPVRVPSNEVTPTP